MSAQPLVQAVAVSKRFEKPVDFAGRIANLLGAANRDVTVRAVSGVDLSIAPGEVVGLVGESGCGKSTLGRIVAGIYPPSEGSLCWKGRPVAELQAAERRAYALGVQMIFQDAMASLNPRMRVVDIVGEAPVVHGLVPRSGQGDLVDQLFSRVGLDPGYKRRYPHQFSGGQRARIGIARALAVNPTLLVCDESVAALDVSIQAQVLNLFADLRQALGLAYLFISHDLGVVRHISDRVVIMYLGRIVEEGPAEALFADARHPYTQALLANIPTLSPGKRRFATVKGEIPSPINPPPGCHFHPRCPAAGPRCSQEVPALTTLPQGRKVACHLLTGGVD